MSGRRQSGAPQLVVVLGSQGALPVAVDLLKGLPDDFPAAVVDVQHRVATAHSALAQLLRYRTRLPVFEPQDGDPLRPGALYVPAAGVQTTLGADRQFRVTDGACVGDPLMASAAEVYGPAALGIVLSGRLRDGAAGLTAIKQAGGRGLIQAPATAQADSMPLAAMATGAYDFVLEPKALQAALVALVSVRGAAELLSVRAHPSAAAAAL